jgi:glyoxylase-like metal-dependent hydrolase (beta-lactamase superfamily II)
MPAAEPIYATPALEVARIESLPFGEHTYVVRRPGNTDCLVVDPGFEPAEIIAWLERHGLEPRAILLTHGHSDHIAGNAALKARWPAVPLLIGQGDAAKLTDPTANLSAPFGLPLTSPPADRLLADGERLALAGCELVVREIPGHSAGHVVFILEGENPPLVFGGDVLFQESIGRTDFPDGDFEALAAGIRRHLYTLPPEAIVFPGHGEPTTVGHERRHNPFVPARSSD